jgi:hypothetical protein
MNGLALTEKEPENEFEAALKKLVNIDHIDEPAEEQIKLSLKREEEKKKGKPKSVPKPPAAQNLVGSGATLEQIKQVKPETGPKEGVMKLPPWHPDAAMAGALVVHGADPPPLNEPPPFVGFGVGYNPQAAYIAKYGQPPPQPQQQAPPPQGYPPQQPGYPPQQPGYPPQGYPPQQQPGYPPQGYPPQQPQYNGYPPPAQQQYR